MLTMSGIMFSTVTFAVLYSSIGLAAGASQVDVDCSKAKTSIQNELDKASGPTVIHVHGDCTESVEIEADGIEIVGDGSAISSITGLGTGTIVEISHARRVALRDITISGGKTGVLVTGNSDVELDHVVVEFNSETGIWAEDASWAQLENSTIANNNYAGLYAIRGAQVRAKDTDYTNNGVSASESYGVGVQQASYWQQNGTNSGSNVGVGVWDGGRAEVRAASTSGDGLAAVSSRQSYIRFRKGTVSGDLRANLDSGIILQNGVAFSDSQVCDDAESSIIVNGVSSAACTY